MRRISPLKGALVLLITCMALSATGTATASVRHGRLQACTTLRPPVETEQTPPAPTVVTRKGVTYKEAVLKQWQVVRTTRFYTPSRHCVFRNREPFAVLRMVWLYSVVEKTPQAPATGDTTKEENVELREIVSHGKSQTTRISRESFGSSMPFEGEEGYNDEPEPAWSKETEKEIYGPEEAYPEEPIIVCNARQVYRTPTAKAAGGAGPTPPNTTCKEEKILMEGGGMG